MSNERILKRNMNRYAILQALHFHGTQRRGTLSEKCEIRKSSITTIVSELIQQGVVNEDVPGSLRSRLSLDTTTYYALAASVSPAAISTARVYLDGRTTHQNTAPLQSCQPQDVYATLARNMQLLRDADDGIPLGIGIACPGAINPDTGLIQLAANLGGWRNVNLADGLRNQFGLPVFVDNDVRCQLWCSAWFDRILARDDNLLYISIGSGVSSAAIVHGQRVIGSRHAAGEIGHVRFGNNGRLCSCGRLDCLETYCSLPAILAELAQVLPEQDRPVTAAEISSMAAKKNVIPNVLDRVAERIARAVAWITVELDPQVILLGTDDVAFTRILAKLLDRHIQNELMGLDMQHTEIGSARAIGDACLWGSAGLVIDNAFKEGYFDAHRI